MTFHFRKVWVLGFSGTFIKITAEGAIICEGIGRG